MTSSPQPALHFVAGFDGSPSSCNALHTACLLARDRRCDLTVVYVSHIPALADVAAPMVSLAARQNEQPVSDELKAVASSIVGNTDVQWTFEHREGSIATELLDVARKIDSDVTPYRRVLIVIGSAEQRHDQLLGAVPQHLAHQNHFGLLVVPNGEGRG